MTMYQSHPHYTEDDLERIVARDFPQACIPEVRSLFSRYGNESGQHEKVRVQMACLKCANGNLEALEQTVGIACRDYRDVLADAEYPSYSYDLSREAMEQAIESDWNQLQEWFERR